MAFSPPPRQVVRRRLYITLVAALASLGALAFTASTVVAAHDGMHFFELPIDYRAAISKLDAGWGFQQMMEMEPSLRGRYYELQLSDEEAEATDLMRSKWADEGLLQFWEKGTAIDTSARRANALRHFERFVPRWGTRLHQRRPLVAIALSLLAFAPLLLTLAAARWVAWVWKSADERVEEATDEQSSQAGSTDDAGTSRGAAA